MKYFLTFLNVVTFSIVCSAQSYSDQIKVHREKYVQEFLDGKISSFTSADTQFLDFYPADETYRVSALFEKTTDALPFDLPTMNGSTKKYIEYGTLSFVLKDKPFKLKVYQNLKLLSQEEYKDHLFLPFTDLTSGNESYGGGRYLDFQTGDIKNGKLLIDFNKAYNPYCAYASGYSCPKPPAENNLPAAIRAGEKKFAKAVH